MCLAQGHNARPPVRLEPAVLQSRVKLFTTKPLGSLNDLDLVFKKWLEILKMSFLCWIWKINMRESRKFCQRGSNSDNIVFLIDEGREDPNTTGPVLLRNPIFLWFFRVVGVWTPCPPPSGSVNDCAKYKIVLFPKKICWHIMVSR